PARLKRCTTSALRSRAFVGMQPQFRHTPPGRSSSTATTLRPSCAQRIAETYPPGPVPITATSTLCVAMPTLPMRPDARAILAGRDRVSNDLCGRRGSVEWGEGRVGPPDPFLAAYGDEERVVWNTLTVAPRSRTWSGAPPARDPLHAYTSNRSGSSRNRFT